VASVLHELAQSASVGVVLDEASIPVREAVRGACEMLGLDPLTVANEGKCVAFVAPDRAAAALAAMRRDPRGLDACDIGYVTDAHPGVVRVRTRFGPSRVLDPLSGEPLPRIC
jgi:hydrogenase expression/formation protein HypE